MRNIIKLAGSTYERIRGLKGNDVLKDREVVISKDTSELYLGKENGEFSLLGNVQIGSSTKEIQNTIPEKGRFFYNDESGILYVANGIGWKRAGIRINLESGLTLDEQSGILKVNVDNKSIIVNREGKLETKDNDYGEF